LQLNLLLVPLSKHYLRLATGPVLTGCLRTAMHRNKSSSPTLKMQALAE